MPIEINHRLSIPDDALEERFLAATGPGGQNVNKVATAVQMRCDTRLIDLPPFARDQLRRIAGRRMTAEGIVLISANRFRTQEANREDARRRLAERSEEHTSELQSLMRSSYAVFCLKKTKNNKNEYIPHITNTNTLTYSSTHRTSIQ